LAADAQSHRLLGGVDFDALVLETDLACIRRVDTKQRQRHIRATRTDQPGKAQHLAFIHVEGHIGEHAFSR